MHFDGAVYEPTRDEARLNHQIADIYGLMKDGQWRTLEGIAHTTGHGAASVSAQLRNLRKPRFGGHTVNRRHIQHGLYEYQLVLA